MEDYGIYIKTKTERAVRNTLSYRPQFQETPLTKELRDISEKGIEYTQTFKPELHNNYNSVSLTNILETLLRTYIKRYTFRVILIGEYSLTGVYHLHGSILAPPKMVNSLRRRLPREIGRAELKQIRYTETWIKYCMKDEYNGTYKDIDFEEVITIPQLQTQ